MFHCPFFLYSIPYSSSPHILCIFIQIDDFFLLPASLQLWIIFKVNGFTEKARWWHAYMPTEIDCWLSVFFPILCRLWNIFTLHLVEFPWPSSWKCRNNEKKRKIFFHFLLLELVIKVDSVAALNVYKRKKKSRENKKHSRLRLKGMFSSFFYFLFYFFFKYTKYIFLFILRTVTKRRHRKFDYFISISSWFYCFYFFMVFWK